jgi:hypothetical protein
VGPIRGLGWRELVSTHSLLRALARHDSKGTHTHRADVCQIRDSITFACDHVPMPKGWITRALGPTTNNLFCSIIHGTHLLYIWQRCENSWRARAHTHTHRLSPTCARERDIMTQHLAVLWAENRICCIACTQHLVHSRSTRTYVHVHGDSSLYCQALPAFATTVAVQKGSRSVGPSSVLATDRPMEAAMIELLLSTRG